MQFLVDGYHFAKHCLVALLHLLGIVLLLLGVLKAIGATEKGDITGLGFKSIVFFFLAILCLSV
jgi:hypothetical protein